MAARVSVYLLCWHVHSRTVLYIWRKVVNRTPKLEGPRTCRRFGADGVKAVTRHRAPRSAYQWRVIPTSAWAAREIYSPVILKSGKSNYG